MTNAQITKQTNVTEESIISPIEKKQFSEDGNLFDYALNEKDFRLLVIMIENNPQGFIDKIEVKGSFSYKIFEEIPLNINVDKALEVLEKNRLKGNIYKELNKSLKKHKKRQKKNSVK